ncbi:DUF3500 domain-containing protein [bacterium]|nr:DUF3500 domain-containing protein [bacterium]
MNQSKPFNRRRFLESTAVAAAAASTVSANPISNSAPETLVGELYNSLKAEQKKQICFDWNHQDPKRGLLRTFVANNWNITKAEINSDFYSDSQRAIVQKIFEGIISPEWHERYYQQLEDDAGGFGNEQSVAIFGQPGEGKFELVLTGRHMTLRCDGNSAEHVAFGGPIFYGHAPSFNEDPKHTDNVFWNQAVEANKLYQMLDSQQQKDSLVAKTPREQAVSFKGSKGGQSGLPVSAMSSDQKEHLQKVVGLLTEMYRTSDQEEAMQCLKKQGGLDQCNLSFYRDQDLGKDGVWDNWRLEGPSFVWHYRGAPHVHVWVNVADNPNVKTNA